MERRIHDLLTERLQLQVCQRYGFAKEALELISKGNNFVYRVNDGRHGLVLRLTHQLQKSSDLLRGELDAVQYAVARGVRAPRVIESRQGNVIEAFEDGAGGHFYGLLYERIEGASWLLRHLEPEMLRCWGSLTGQLHRLFANYPRQTTDATLRHRETDWHYGLLDPARHLPVEKQWVGKLSNSIRARIESCPPAGLNHRFIHNDLHPGNFIRTGGGVVLLDFDDAHFNRIETDLAQVLLILLDVPILFADRQWPCSRDEVFELFCRHYVPAYAEHSSFGGSHWESLNDFIQRRIIVLYTDLHRSHDAAHFSPKLRFIHDEFERHLQDGAPVLSQAQLERLHRLGSTAS